MGSESWDPPGQRVVYCSLWHQGKWSSARNLESVGTEFQSSPFTSRRGTRSQAFISELKTCVRGH